MSGLPHVSTSGPTQSPVVHSSHEPSTDTWQYIVVDPCTRCCAIIDPVREWTAEEVTVSMQAADRLLSIIENNRYTVTHIVETHAASPRACDGSLPRSAAWYLRGRLKDRQGYAPEMSSGGAIAGIERAFERKYGAQGRLSTTLINSLSETGTGSVGSMQVRLIPIPGAMSSGRKAFVAGSYVFGAHSLAATAENVTTTVANRKSTSAQRYSQVCTTSPEDADGRLWASLQRILSMPETFRLYLDCGKPRKSSSEPFETVGQCRISNPFYGMQLEHFIAKRALQRKLTRKTNANTTATARSGGHFEKMKNFSRRGRM